MSSPLTSQQARAAISADNARLNVFNDLAPLLATPRGGALTGWPIAVKANIAIAGLPCTAGIGALRESVAIADAPVVAALRAAGADVLGSVNMEEAALGATTRNPHFGNTHNPRRPGFTAGGSSGGSAAAVAAGMARAALGTDTMGSCRIPAAYCGVVGFKPSFGAISVAGILPLAQRLDHVGILAANVADVASVYAVIGSAVAAAMQTVKRIGVLDEAVILQLQPEVAAAYRRALTRLAVGGYTLVAQSVPKEDLASCRRAGLLIAEAELAVTLADALRTGGEGVSPHLRSLIAFAAGKSAPDLVRAHRRLDGAALIQEKLFANVDALAWPTAPQTAFALDVAAPADQADYTCLANFTGAPALSLPLPVNGLPVGLQIMMPRGQDAALLTLAQAVLTLFGSQ